MDRDSPSEDLPTSFLQKYLTNSVNYCTENQVRGIITLTTNKKELKMSIEEYMLDLGMDVDMMNFEDRQLAIVKSVTSTRAYFFQGTMFLETEDSEIATKVYNALAINNQSIAIAFGKCGQSETSYDFI